MSNNNGITIEDITPSGELSSSVNPSDAKLRTELTRLSYVSGEDNAMLWSVAKRQTADLRVIVGDLLINKAKDLSNWIDRVAETQPDKAANLYLRLLEHAVPKLNRTVDDMGADVKPQQSINIFSDSQAESILRTLASRKTENTSLQGHSALGGTDSRERELDAGKVMPMGLDSVSANCSDWKGYQISRAQE